MNQNEQQNIAKQDNDCEDHIVLPEEPICPIIFRGKKNKEEMYVPVEAPTQLPYSVPLNLLQAANLDFMTKAPDQFMTDYLALPTRVKGTFAGTDIRLQKIAIYEYIMRNTFDNFSQMIDNLDPDIRKILVDWTNIKEKVYNALFDPIYMHQSFNTNSNNSLRDIIMNTIDTMYSTLHNYNFKTMEEYKLLFTNDVALTTCATHIISSLYMLIVYGIDTALTETFNNVYGFANYQNIMQNIHNILDDDKKYKVGDHPYDYSSLASAIKSFMVEELTSIMPTVEELVYTALFNSTHAYATFKDRLWAKDSLDRRLENEKRRKENGNKFIEIPEYDEEPEF